MKIPSNGKEVGIYKKYIANIKKIHRGRHVAVEEKMKAWMKIENWRRFQWQLSTTCRKQISRKKIFLQGNWMVMDVKVMEEIKITNRFQNIQRNNMWFLRQMSLKQRWKKIWHLKICLCIVHDPPQLKWQFRAWWMKPWRYKTEKLRTSTGEKEKMGTFFSPLFYFWNCSTEKCTGIFLMEEHKQ